MTAARMASTRLAATIAVAMLALSNCEEISAGAADAAIFLNDSLVALQVSVLSGHSAGTALETKPKAGGEPAKAKAMYKSMVVFHMMQMVFILVTLVRTSRSEEPEIDRNTKLFLTHFKFDYLGFLLMVYGYNCQNMAAIAENNWKYNVWPAFYMVFLVFDMVCMYMTWQLNNEKPSFFHNSREITFMYRLKTFWHVMNFATWVPDRETWISMNDKRRPKALTQLAAFARKVRTYRARAADVLDRMSSTMADGGNMDRVRAALLQGTNASVDEGTMASARALLEKMRSSGLTEMVGSSLEEVDRWVDVHGEENLLQIGSVSGFWLNKTKAQRMGELFQSLCSSSSADVASLRKSLGQSEMPRQSAPDHDPEAPTTDPAEMVKTADRELEPLWRAIDEAGRAASTPPP